MESNRSQTSANGKTSRPKSGTQVTRKKSASRRSTLIAALKREHQTIRQLLDGFDAKGKAGSARRGLREFASKWMAHDAFEQTEIVPAALGDKPGSQEVPAELGQAMVQRDLIGVMLVDLAESDENDPFFAAKVRVLADLIKRLVASEEKPKTGLYALAQAGGLDVEAVQGRFEEHARQFENAESAIPPMPIPKALRGSGSRQSKSQESNEMERGSNMRERDEQGRFMRDDDDDRRRGGGYASQSRDDYDDDRRGSSGSRSSSSGRGASRRSDDDDDGRGWYGDSEGHSEAARRGWEDRQGSSRSRGRSEDYDDDRNGGRSRSSRNDEDYRGGGRSRSGQNEDDFRGGSRSRYDEDRGGSRSRSSRDDDDLSGSRGRSSRNDDDDRGDSRSRSSRDDADDSRSGGRGGWFGDSEGHSRASREGWENRDHGPSGWFGDREGHSEASRRGWEERGGSRSSGRYSRDDEDNRGSRSRSRYDDDDRRGSRR